MIATITNDKLSLRREEAERLYRRQRGTNLKVRRLRPSWMPRTRLLENYTYNMRNALKDEKVAGILDPADIENEHKSSNVSLYQGITGENASSNLAASFDTEVNKNFGLCGSSNVSSLELRQSAGQQLTTRVADDKQSPEEATSGLLQLR
ncbi:heat shock 70 kDa protein 4-like [Malus sylvestris]|uniref:heat shock 70 kDa protein 4-like n=1 Tax=Malus sylvestris TaxID=3752 RepID=UPI0021AC5252|nr:heat shock 70 kDa protein 4-like [Malus sylvestris]